MHTERAELGKNAEDLAAAFLQRHNVEILLRNYRRRLGEIDIVARDGEVLLIVEVRTRSSEKFGGAAASVDAFKQRKIVRASQQLIQKNSAYARMRARFDVVVVRDPHSLDPQVEWIKHAFEAT